MASFLERTLRKKQTITNFSTSIKTSIRDQIISDAAPLLKAPSKCRKIWEALQLADYKKEGSLNEHALQVLFETQGKNIKELLQVKNSEELLDLLDEEELGIVSEDNQILLFSIIKERMQVCASELCKIYEYNLNKEMLKSIRILETDIIEYQSALRKRTNEKEIDMYKQIGVDKQESFENHWKGIFEKFEENCREKLEKLTQTHRRELELVDEEIYNDIGSIK